MNKVLITGGSGFIGNRLVRYLDNKKISIVLLSRSHETVFETIICDLKSDLIPENSMLGIDTVFHLAAQTHDTRSDLIMAQEYIKINVDASIKLAELAIKSGVKRFVFISSVKAGGSAIKGQYLTEKNQGEPEGVYGRTKREAELKLLKMSLKSGMDVSILRPSLVYGPNVKGNLELMMNGIRKGWFPSIPNVHNKRTMIHVDDLVVAIILVAKDDRAKGEIFNVTDGEVHSTREVYESMCHMLKKRKSFFSLPKFFFTFLSFLSPKFKYKVDKLFGDELYSSKKIESIGFKPKLSLTEMNETSF